MAFDLEKAIAAWRRPFEYNRAISSEDLEELEGSLRDRVEALVEVGLSEEAAFREALRRLGSYDTAEFEYRKVYWGKLKRRRQLLNELSWRLSMLKNYLKVALRNLRRQKGYAFINIAGLAVGIAVCLLIFLFIHNERSFDTFHSKHTRIYRLLEVQTFEGISGQDVAETMYPMGPTMKSELPEVEAFVRVDGEDDLVQYGDKRVIMEQALWTDPDFFKVFDFPLVQGDERTALNAPNTAVLTEETARKVFGGQDPLGETIMVGEHSLRVTGVLRDVPENSHLQFDAVYSFSTREKPEDMNSWNSNWVVTYLLLKEGSTGEALQAKLYDYQTRYMGEESHKDYKLYLQPLTEIHLGSTHVTHDDHNYKKFDGRYIETFFVLALFVLAIAAINFMNLSTAQAARRSQEVGVRKAIGARRAELTAQFIGESVVLTFVALFFALLLSFAAIPFVEQLTDRQFSLARLASASVAGATLGLAMLVGVLAGLYPAVLMSSFKPMSVLKGASGFSTGRGQALFRNGLVIAQFAIAIAMIVGTVLTLQQLRFMQNRDPGYDRRQVVTIPLPSVERDEYELLKSEWLKLPEIQNVTASSQRLGNNINQWSLRVDDPLAEHREMVPSHLHVDFNYLEFYGLELVNGRDFSKDRSADRGNAYIVNESLARDLGLEDPIGKRLGLSWKDSLGSIIGVVKDFNFNSMHHPIQPIALSVQPWEFDEASVRVHAAGMQRALAGMEAVWLRIVKDWPFQYEFLDHHFARLYSSDRKVSDVVGVLAGIAIIIACLGLFGLSAISIEQRRKEISIRKVLGASVTGLVALLSKNFVRLVAVAFVLAVPVVYFMMQRWLEDFAYRIEIGPGIFLLAGGLALVIAMLTVSYQATKAALADPVKSLRYE